MNNRTNGWTAGILAVALCALVLVFATPRATAQQGGRGSNLLARVVALEATVAAQQGQIASLTSRNAVLEEKTQFMSVLGDTTLFSGTNVQVVNGLGSTILTNGLGNLIVGYNEFEAPFGDERGGSHNIVVGIYHDYTAVGGLVAGIRNNILESWASVTGGRFNTASGYASSVTGGSGNVASGASSAVTGGALNTATDSSSTVSGGALNRATHPVSTVSGGRLLGTNVREQWVGGAYHTP